MIEGEGEKGKDGKSGSHCAPSSTSNGSAKSDSAQYVIMFHAQLHTAL